MRKRWRLIKSDTKNRTQHTHSCTYGMKCVHVFVACTLWHRIHNQLALTHLKSWLIFLAHFSHSPFGVCVCIKDVTMHRVFSRCFRLFNNNYIELRKLFSTLLLTVLWTTEMWCSGTTVPSSSSSNNSIMHRSSNSHSCSAKSRCTRCQLTHFTNTLLTYTATIANDTKFVHGSISLSFSVFL